MSTGPSYDHIQKIVDNWNRPEIAQEVICARAVILDENLGRPEDALTLTEEAIGRLGDTEVLLRQKAKLLSHLGRIEEAADLALSIEERIGSGNFDRALGLRDAGLYAAKAGRYADAARLFTKAHDILVDQGTNAPLAAGLMIENALAHWRDGNPRGALEAAGNALAEVALFRPSGSRQAERAHQFARAIAGLFFSESPVGQALNKPPFGFGAASALESSAAKLTGIDLKELADNWRVLAAVEAAVDVDAGIDARSMAAAGESFSTSVESVLRVARFEAALRRMSIEGAMDAGGELAALTKSRQQRAQSAEDIRIDPAAFHGMAARPIALDASAKEVAQSFVVDIILASAIGGQFNAAQLAKIEQISRGIFGDLPELELIFKAASGNYAVGPDAPRLVLLVHGIAADQEKVAANPNARFTRDMMALHHAKTSLARNVFRSILPPWVLQGWRRVWSEQRFLLRSPSRSEASIGRALDDLAADGDLRAASDLLLAFRPVVTSFFADSWFDMPSVPPVDATREAGGSA